MPVALRAPVCPMKTLRSLFSAILVSSTVAAAEKALIDTTCSSSAKMSVVPVTFVPYYAWGNRGYPEMSVWISVH